MTLVIFSYPQHFHIMQLALRQARQCVESIDQVYVVWDDVYPIQELGYQNAHK